MANNSADMAIVCKWMCDFNWNMMEMVSYILKYSGPCLRTYAKTICEQNKICQEGICSNFKRYRPISKLNFKGESQTLGEGRMQTKDQSSTSCREENCAAKRAGVAALASPCQYAAVTVPSGPRPAREGRPDRGGAARYSSYQLSRAVKQQIFSM